MLLILLKKKKKILLLVFKRACLCWHPYLNRLTQIINKKDKEAHFAGWHQRTETGRFATWLTFYCRFLLILIHNIVYINRNVVGFRGRNKIHKDSQNIIIFYISPSYSIEKSLWLMASNSDFSSFLPSSEVTMILFCMKQHILHFCFHAMLAAFIPPSLFSGVESLIYML